MKRIDLVAMCFMAGAAACVTSAWGANTYMINKTFVNTTGQTQTDLHYTIYGNVGPYIREHRHPRFPEHTHTFVDDPPFATRTEFDWWGGEILPGQSAMVCEKFSASRPERTLRFAKLAYWTRPDPANPGHVIRTRTPLCSSSYVSGDPEIHIVAPSDLEGLSLDVFDFSYAVLQTPLELQDLTWNNPAIPWVQVPGSATLSDGQDFIAANFAGNSGEYLVFQMASKFHGDPVESAGFTVTQEQIPGPASLVCLGLGIIAMRRRR